MKRLLLIICIVWQYSASAQEMWGFANSNFAGSSGMNLNPTSMMLMPYTWEVTILSADISLQNNYVAFARDKAVNTAEGTPDPHRGVIDYYSPGNKSGSAHVMLQLPSFTFRTCNNMAFGFHMGVRTDLSVRNVPSLLSKFSYEGIIYSPLHGASVDLSGIRAGQMSWAEAGISFGKQINKNPDKKLLGAITLKGLAAIEGASLNVNNGSLGIVNDTSVNINNFNAQMYTAMPESPGQILSFPNRGVAVDIGVCYVSNSNHERFENGKLLPIKKYDYRLGASLIDAGFVSFGGNPKTYDFNVSHADFIKGNGTDSLMNVNEKKGKFLMALPTALSVQYDRCLKPRVYLNFSAIQRVPMPMPHIDRPNQLSATLRYEATFFEIAFPYSFYDYYQHRIGAAVRYGILYIGTDKLGTFINNKEISGVDFYFGLRLTNFDFAKRTKTSKPPCPAY